MRKRLDRVRKDCEWDEMQESRVNDGRSGDRRTKWEILASRNKKRNTAHLVVAYPLRGHS